MLTFILGSQLVRPVPNRVSKILQLVRIVVSTLIQKLHHLFRGVSHVSIRKTDPPRILHVQKDEALEFLVQLLVYCRPGPRHLWPAVEPRIVKRIRALRLIVAWNSYLRMKEVQLEQRLGVLQDEILRVTLDGELYMLQAQRAKAGEV